MKAITGKRYKTSFGTFVVLEEPIPSITAGDTVTFEKQRYTVKEIVAPTRPGGKWSVMVDKIEYDRL